jgi:hypothetical protein
VFIVAFSCLSKAVLCRPEAARRSPAPVCHHDLRLGRDPVGERPFGDWYAFARVRPRIGGTSITLRGSGFQTGTKVTIGGKSASVTFKDTNTLTVTTPALTTGAQQLVISNPDGETVSLDAAFLAQ